MRNLPVLVAILTALLALVFAYTVVRLDLGTVANILLAAPFVSVWLVPMLYWGRREKQHSGSRDHVIQYVGYLSMGWISFLLIATLLKDAFLLAARQVASIELHSLITGYGYLIVLGGAALGFVLGALRASKGPTIRSLELAFADLPEALDGFRIAQISDLHVGTTIRRAYVQRVVEMTRALGPDLVALTGDIVDGPFAALQAEAEPLGELEPRDRVFFVTGNHEYYAGAGDWLRFFAGLGHHVLSNASRLIEHKGARLLVGGVTDPAERMLGPDKGPLPARARGSEAADFCLLLAHNPKLAPAGAAAGFDLQLSGHTHAGQFFPWTWVTKMVHAPHFAGLSREGPMQVYVSAGTGTWGPPLRLGTHPEISLIILRRR